MKLNRKSVDRSGNGFCGPTTLAAIFGVSTAEAAVMVRRACPRLGDKPIKGMYNRDLLDTLRANGYRVTEEAVPRHYAPAKQWTGHSRESRQFSWPNYEKRVDERPISRAVRLVDLPHDEALPDGNPYSFVELVKPTLAAWLRGRKNKNGTYVINVTGHYVLVSGRKFIDTFSKGEWVNIGKAPGRRKRIVHVWEVTK